MDIPLVASTSAISPDVSNITKCTIDHMDDGIPVAPSNSIFQHPAVVSHQLPFFTSIMDWAQTIPFNQVWLERTPFAEPEEAENELWPKMEHAVDSDFVDIGTMTINSRKRVVISSDEEFSNEIGPLLVKRRKLNESIMETMTVDISSGVPDGIIKPFILPLTDCMSSLQCKNKWYIFEEGGKMVRFKCPETNVQQAENKHIDQTADDQEEQRTSDDEDVEVKIAKKKMERKRILKEIKKQKRQQKESMDARRFKVLTPHDRMVISAQLGMQNSAAENPKPKPSQQTIENTGTRQHNGTLSGPKKEMAMSVVRPVDKKPARTVLAHEKTEKPAQPSKRTELASNCNGGGFDIDSVWSAQESTFKNTFVSETRIPKRMLPDSDGSAKATAYVSPLDKRPAPKAQAVYNPVTAPAPAPAAAPRHNSLPHHYMPRNGTNFVHRPKPHHQNVSAAAVTASRPPKVLVSLLKTSRRAAGARKKTVRFKEGHEEKEFEKDFHHSHRRAPVPNISHGSAVDVASGSGPTETSALSLLDEICAQILKWNTNWLKEVKATRDAGNFELPPITPFPLKQLEKSYPSFGECATAYKSLMLHEVFEMAYEKFVLQMKDTEPAECQCFVVRMESVSTVFKDFEVAATVRKDAVHRFSKHVLSVFRLADTAHTVQTFFGLITRCRISPVRRKDEVTPQMASFVSMTKENAKEFCFVNFTLRAKAKTNLPVYEKGSIIMKTLCNLGQTLHLVTALSHVESSPLKQAILKPAQNKAFHFLPANAKSNLISSNPSIPYRPDQLQIISSCVQALEKPGPCIILVDGHMAGGKTQTVAGLIEEIQKRRMKTDFTDKRDEEREPLEQRNIILLVASRDDILDEGCRRLIATNRFYEQVWNEKKKFVKFVRMGKAETMADDIRRYSLDTLVENNAQSVSSAEVEDIIQRRKKQEEELAHNRGLLHSFDADSQPSDVDRLEMDALLERIKELEGDIKQSRRKEMVASKNWLRQSMVYHADVVAVILNDLESVEFLQGLQKIKFSCALMDGACQATEMETMVPLAMGVEKLFLFGDSRLINQKVISTVARERGFGRSFFWRSLSNFEPGLEPVLRLSGETG